MEGGLSDRMPASCPLAEGAEQPERAQLGVPDNGHHPVLMSLWRCIDPAEQRGVCAEVPCMVVVKAALCVRLDERLTAEFQFCRLQVTGVLSSPSSMNNKECDCPKGSVRGVCHRGGGADGLEVGSIPPLSVCPLLTQGK